MNAPLYDLYHIYVGKKYLGCIRGKNPVHAVSQWSKLSGLSQIILRAEKSTSVKGLKEAKR